MLHLDLRKNLSFVRGCPPNRILPPATLRERDGRLKCPNSIRASRPRLVCPVVLSTLLAVPVMAHNVEVSEDVAATFHIEPNHNPRVGEPAQAWFALTSRGGKTIPLSDCNCSLAVYALPRSAEAQPVINPPLQAINVEKYQEIPGASIVFPSAGAYELEISGTAKGDASFQPFQLSYTVNVRP